MKKTSLWKLRKHALQQKVKKIKSKPGAKKKLDTFKDVNLLKSKNENMKNYNEVFQKKWQDKKDARLFYENNQPTEKITKKIVKRKKGTLEEFNKTITARIKRIKRRTLNKISIDKYHVLNCVKALKGFFSSQSKANEEDKEEKKEEKEDLKKDEIYLKVTLNKKYERVFLRNIKM